MIARAFVWALVAASIYSASAAAATFYQPVASYTMGSCQFLDCTNHLGTDRMCSIGTDVVAISRAYAAYYKPDAGSFGGCGVNGVALWLKHRKENGTYFWALYGHVTNSVVTTANSVISVDIPAGARIADIANYFPCYALSGGCSSTGCPHLHFGIWDSPTAPCGESGSVRCNQWGYGSQGSFVDPNAFLSNQHPYPETLPAFATQYVNQYINGADINEVSGEPGMTFTFAVAYKNVGTSTWLNTGGPTGTSYVELKSVNYPAGAVVDSWLDPVGWLSGRQRVVACSPASVATNATATFSFQGAIPATSAPGDYQVYFRPFHGTTGMDDWGGMYFLIHVLPSASPCPGREISHSPCVSSSTCYPASASNLTALPELQFAQWEAVGSPLPSALDSKHTYSLGFEYKAESETRLTAQFTSNTAAGGSTPRVIEAVLPGTKGEWKIFWGAPFSPSSEPAAGTSRLKLTQDSAARSGMEIRSARILMIR